MTLPSYADIGVWLAALIAIAVPAFRIPFPMGINRGSKDFERKHFSREVVISRRPDTSRFTWVWAFIVASNLG